jgi:NAD(P)-dependent dehydrogenase (short-subunit alcohol dehydrogenase family)
MFNFEGKTVLVTGGSRGIGQAVVQAFAEAGARVAIHYHQQKEIAKQVRAALPGTGHCLVQADLANGAAIEQMVYFTLTVLGKIDILVNNAGIYQEHPLDETDYNDWRQIWQETIDVNLLGAVNTSYCVAQQMMERRQGRIINITSRGAFRGEPTATAYAASKAGLNAFSQSLAQHLAPYNISVMAVAPGWVETDMSRKILDGPIGESVRQQSPLNRVARPEEVAQTVLFLASESATFLTGAIVDVNGASYLRS